MMSLALKGDTRLPLAAGVPFYSGNAGRVFLRHFLMESDGPSIANLLFRSGPSAITGFIISIFVWVAINRAAFWAFPHISKEILELEPPIAHADAPSAVVLIGVMFLVSTSVKHLLPRFVFRTFMHAVLGGRLSLKASARGFALESDAGSSRDNVATAIAPKEPKGFTLPVETASIDGYKATVPLTSGHRWEFSSGSHFDLFDRLRWLGPAGVASTASGPLLYSTAKGRVLDLFKPKEH